MCCTLVQVSRIASEVLALRVGKKKKATAETVSPPNLLPSFMVALFCPKNGTFLGILRTQTDPGCRAHTSVCSTELTPRDQHRTTSAQLETHNAHNAKGKKREKTYGRCPCV